MPGITREGIAQLSLLETALWPLKGGARESSIFETAYHFKAGEDKRKARVSVYAPLGLQSIDEFILWGLLGTSLSRSDADHTLLATPYWLMRRLGMETGGFQYDQFRASLERLALVAYQNTAFYNPVTQQHERVTLHFFSTYLPTRGRGADVDAERAWRIEWSPLFFQMCQATGGTLLFDLDLYRKLTPAARRLFLKLKDRFWRSKRIFLNVDDLTIHGLGFSANRPLKKRKFDLTACIQELLSLGIIELGKGQSTAKDLFLKRGTGLYVVQFFEGPYFRRPLAERTRSQKQAIADDPLYQPLRSIGIDEAAIRRVFRECSRGLLQRWIRVTDAAMHEQPRGFPGFKTSPAAFFIDAIQNERMPPDWIYAHEKERQRRKWEDERQSQAKELDQHREAYQAERQAAFDQYLRTPEGQTHFERYHSTFLEFYRTVEPHRFRDAAREATEGKIDREHFTQTFPDFSVWLLERQRPNT
ncbi:MAG: hypothetical protein HYV60_19190 [Planctomycetia bacterium]|nr:hypothetical protein [Planctomycetia bacterium]